MVDTVVLLGDSIRLGYQPYAAGKLRDSMVWGPGENCRSSRYLLAHLERLVLPHIHGRALVHVNAGAHDIRREPENEFEVLVNLAEYVRNMEAILDRLEAESMVAQVVLATTTPVDDVRHRASKTTKRLNKDVNAYNVALIDLARRRGCMVSDLYSAVRRCPFDPISSDGIHMTETGKQYLGVTVAAFVRPYVAVDASL